jgi:hypothetical protein
MVRNLVARMITQKVLYFCENSHMANHSNFWYVTGSSEASSSGGPREAAPVASHQVLRRTRALGTGRRSPPLVCRDSPPPPPPPPEGFMADVRKSGPSVEVEDG